MRSKEIFEALNIFYEIREPVMIWGPPGVGKSDVARQVAQSRQIGYIDVRLSQLDPVDLRGIPASQDGRTIWNIPGFLPTSGEGIFMLDEINSGAQATMAAGYQLVLDRRLGDYELPSGWAIFAAGNRATDGAIVNPMPMPLKNRFSHLEFEVNHEDWCAWALTHKIDPAIIAFIRFQPQMLNEFEPRNDSKEEQHRMQKIKSTNAFATPRTYEKLSRVISRTHNPAMINAVIGESAGGHFRAYLKYWDQLPNLQRLILNPNKAKVPTEPAVLYAVASGLPALANEKTVDAIFQYAEKLPTEFSTLMVKDIHARYPGVIETDAFDRWSDKNASLLLAV